MTTLILPPSPVNRVSSCARLPQGALCLLWFDLMFPGNVELELDALLEDHGVSCTVIEDMLTLERAVLPNPSVRAEWLLVRLIDRALNRWGHAALLDGGDGEDDKVHSETDTALPDDDDDHNIASLASQPSSSLQPSRFQVVPACSRGSVGFLFLVVSGLLRARRSLPKPRRRARSLRTCLPLERAVHWGTLRDSSLSQAYRSSTGRNCARFQLTSLPPPFSRLTVLISLFNFWNGPMRGLKGETMTSTSSFFPWLPQSLFFIKTDPWWAQQSRYTRPLPELLAAVAGLLARREPHNAPTLHATSTVHSDVAYLSGWNNNTCSRSTRTSQLCQKERLMYTSEHKQVGDYAWVISVAFWVCQRLVAAR